jgi:hypothetical protein
LISYTFNALWVTDWVSAYAEGWHILSVQNVLPALEQLNEGGWMLVLFNAEPTVSLPSLECVPSEPQEAINFVDSMSAGAAIFSWHDDLEWIVVTK